MSQFTSQTQLIKINNTTTIMKSFIIGTVLLSSAAFGMPVSAQEGVGNGSGINDRMQELQTIHAELKEQVNAGEITREEAIAEWQSLIADLRTEKDRLIEERKADIENRVTTAIAKLEAEDPEKAEALAARYEEVLARRADYQAERSAIRAQIEAGEITREEAVMERKQLNEEYRATVKNTAAEYRNDRKTERNQNAEDRMNGLENRIERHEEKIDAAEDRIEQRENRVETTENRVDRLENRLDRRESRSNQE